MASWKMRCETFAHPVSWLEGITKKAKHRAFFQGFVVASNDSQTSKNPSKYDGCLQIFVERISVVP